MYTLNIANAEVMLAGELREVDIVIDSEAIVALVPRGTRCEAAETVDATGLVALPGGIDTHTHTRTPGYEYKEDFDTASAAAAAGGVTTIIDMPNVEPPTDTVERFLEKRELAASSCRVDWGHWVAGTKPEEAAEFAQAGATGFKIFQVSGAYPHDPRLAVNDDDAMLRSFRAIAETGLPCLVHPFNQKLFDGLSAEAFTSGLAPTGELFSRLYATEEVWSTAVYSLLALQRLSGVRLHLLHTHSAQSLALVRAARLDSRRITAEVDPKYYELGVEDLKRLGGRGVPAGFVRDEPGRLSAILRALSDGTINNVGTDHAPHTLAEVSAAEEDAWSAHIGSPQLDWYYSLLLTMVADGHISLARCVELAAEGPARLVGVWPRKGALLPGSDADIVLVDMGRDATVVDSELKTKVGWSPYVGRRLKGVVVATYLRGTLICKEREIIGEPGSGNYIPGRPQ